MGRTVLVCRLAMRDIRHRPVQALLLLLVITTATATLTLALALQGTTRSPYARTRAATNGPDVVGVLFPNGSPQGPATTVGPGGGPAAQGSANAARLVALEHAAGVAASSGPFPVTWAALRTGHMAGSAEVEGRGAVPSPVDRPKLLQGSWIRAGGVVVEASFASALGIGVGDRLGLGGHSFVVTGIAVTAAIPDYPDTCSHLGCFLAGVLSSYNPGLVWATRADARRIARAADSTPLAYFLNLKLRDPAGASSFANRYDAGASPTAPYLFPWQHIRAGDAEVIARVQQVLYFGTVLLALLAIASVVVLVGGRIAEQTRRVGLLKATGGTPGLIAVVLLLEHALVGLCAAGAGLAAGWLAAPLIDQPGAGLIGAPAGPALAGSTVGPVVALALAVAFAATFVPAIRAARQSTVAALEDAATPVRRRPAVITLSAHLPAPLLVGVRLAVRRPRRLLLSAFSIAVATSGLVVALLWHATAGNFLGTRITQASTIISVMLVILAAVNMIFIAWTTTLDARHPAAVARALGTTPGQITAGLSAAQLLPALAGALLGIVGGIGIYKGPRNGAGLATVIPVLWLAALVAATLLAVAALTAIPARIGARRPAAEVLQSEAA